MAADSTSSIADTTVPDRFGLSGFTSTAHAILRIGAGLMFMQHGVQKLFGWLGGNAVDLFSLMGLAGILETFGGLAIVLGLLTRPVAVILFVEMVIAYFMAHVPQGFFPIQNGGEKAILFAITWLFLLSAGPGPASLDRRLFGSKSSDEPQV